MTKRIAIIGLGLLGGSLARALKTCADAPYVIGYDIDKQTLAYGKQQGFVDEATTDLAYSVSQADIVVLAVAMAVVPSLLDTLVQHVKPPTTLTDVVSIKGALLDCIKTQAPTLLPQWVLGHPMRGAERQGIKAADENLFAGGTVILTAVTETSPERLATVKTLWERLNARVIEMSPQRHDEIIAMVSHLPHALAFAFTSTLNQQADVATYLACSGGGFRDFTRIAGSSPALWTDILINNKEAMLSHLEQFTKTLQDLSKYIKDNKHHELQEMLTQGKQARDLLEKCT